MGNNSKLPLEGIKVVELASIVAAPVASRMLCAFGADVIKVESILGDELRGVGKTRGVPNDDGKNPIFTIPNSNKRLIAINFKTNEGKAAILELISKTDVFITNVREGSLKRNGLDYDSLKLKFPKLIYAHFSGFGPKGPDASNPGFDNTAFWLRSGPLADWQVKGSFPFLPTYAFGDMATSSTLLSGILMAIIAREKTGEGTKVETSLFASGIWCNSVGVVTTQFEKKHLNPDPFNPTSPFDNYYLCSDEKWIGIYVNEYTRDKAKFAKLFNIEDILDDQRYNDIESLNRSGVLPEAVSRINKVIKQKTSVEWKAILTSNNISCEIMHDTADICHDDQAIDNAYIEQVEYSDDLKVWMPCPPIFFSNYTRKPYSPTGGIGDDTLSILQELGYSDEQIEAMKELGAIR